MNNITQKFVDLLPDRGGKASTEDNSLVIKTSPTIWEYEMFRLEWDRRTMLREIDLMMRSDTRIKRANKVLAATTVRRGITVTVTSETSDDMASRAQEVINELMRDCQINAKLPSWARILPKEGDLFLNPIVDLKERKIKNIKRLPAITMQRNDDMTGNFPDVNKAFQQIDPISLQVLGEFPLWAINHIRYDHEEGDRYGQSQYLACRGYWRKLNMTEEDLVVRRRTRAPQRRLHSIGTKDNPQNWTEVEKYKDTNKLTPKTAQITTDYYSNGLTDIKTLDGDAHLDEIDDVRHLQEVYMIGTAVPLHILGFGQNVNRDIVEDQRSQFKEDTQELRGLLENGDSSPYSGLRFIFDFALSLQGINPLLVDYNVRWFDDDNETANDRVERVVKLRATQPDPLLSRKTALTVISKDVGLEGEAAIEAELEAIRLELEEDRQEQLVMQATVNPSNPSTSPLSKVPLTDTIDVKKKLKSFFPLHGAKAAKIEAGFVVKIRKLYGKVLADMEPDLEAAINKIETLRGSVYTDAVQPPPLAIQHITDLFDKAWVDHQDGFVDAFFQLYETAAGYARSNVAKQVKIEVATDFINPDITHYFQTQSSVRVTKINATTRKALQDQMAAAYRGQENMADTIRRIRSVVNCDSPVGRAEMIARTELAFAYSKGLTATYREVGVHRLEWRAVMDARTCPICSGNNGEVFTIDEIEASLPAHPRCRCTVVEAS